MIAQPGEAMRLDHGNDAPRPDALARSGEHGADFDRVVAVIVDDRHDTLTRRYLADLGEAALDARETVEARGDLVVGNAHVQRHRDRNEDRKSVGVGTRASVCEYRG